MMTSKQTSLYWREWAAVRKADPHADRHQLHARALGKPKSSKAFTNADLDKVLGVFRSVSQPANLNSQVRQIDQPRTRLLFAINRQLEYLAVLVKHPKEYLKAVLQDRFHTTFIENLSAVGRCCDDAQDSSSAFGVPDSSGPSSFLPHAGLPSVEIITDSELTMLRNTLTRCVISLRQKAGLTVAELEIAARRQALDIGHHANGSNTPVVPHAGDFPFETEPTADNLHFAHASDNNPF